MTELPITFQPAGRTVYVLPGTAVLEAAARAGLAVQTPCGGEGTCGKCRVRFLSDPPAPTEADRAAFAPGQLADGWRLACRHSLTGPARLSVPAESVYGTAEQILTGDGRAAVEVRPAVRRRFVRLDPPTLADERSDLTRLREALCEPALTAPADLLRRLPGLLRDSDWAVTATLADDRLIDLAGGERGDPPLGAAFDIGTTTIVGTLMELTGGAERAVAARINPQVAFGDDVVSRILVCREQPDGLDKLHRLIVEAVGQMLDELAADAGVATSEICEVSVAGNTTMRLLFAGVTPGPLGAIPFAAAFSDGLLLEAAELGLAIHPRGRVYLAPAIGGFVGGDTVAGIAATDLAAFNGCAMLIDIGTNGEIVLARRGRLWAASTAAGPAFEGARIRMGMRATAGAIEKVIIDSDVQVNVIGNVHPVGLCGTALIDAAAGLLTAGVLDTTGRLAPRGEQRADLPEALARRIEGDAADTRFVLSPPDGDRPAVALVQRDFRQLQLASGAIRAGVAILLDRAGLTPGDLDAVFLAGAFGNYIRPEHARRIGLLPEVPIERIHFVGNAASMGAKLALMSTQVRQRSARVARDVEHVDLSGDMNFQMRFADAMIFPER